MSECYLCWTEWKWCHQAGVHSIWSIKINITLTTHSQRIRSITPSSSLVLSPCHPSTPMASLLGLSSLHGLYGLYHWPLWCLWIASGNGESIRKINNTTTKYWIYYNYLSNSALLCWPHQTQFWPLASQIQTSPELQPSVGYRRSWKAWGLYCGQQSRLPVGKWEWQEGTTARELGLIASIYWCYRQRF